MLVRPSWALLVAAVAVAGTRPALAADGAFTLEAPAAAALGDPQRPWTRPGALPAAAVYLSSGLRLLEGLRLRSGVFPGGEAPGAQTRAFVTLTAALRVRPFIPEQATRRTEGPWIELAGGVHLTTETARPSAEAGLGWGFRVGSATLGPALRYVEVVEPAGTRETRLALLGLELGFSTRPISPAPRSVVAQRAPRPSVWTDRDKDGIPDLQDKCPLEPEDRDGFQDEDGCPDPDNDHDGIADAVDRCPNEAEVVNGVADDDGCPDEGVIEVHDNRIVLDSRVLFDQDRARVKTAARTHLQAIVTLWKQHPEWKRLVIEGHTDARGPERYNEWLSTERATRVRKALVEMGLPEDRIEIKGLGRSHPLDSSGTEEAHRRNRRVEFVIVGPPSATASTSP
jgi:outer membrane protein OmpA-like peptidoglycan-associated protein